MGVLVIENVDFELLEKQRKGLNSAMFALERGNPVSAYDLGCLRGIENLLDSWSDKRHHAVNKGEG